MAQIMFTESPTGTGTSSPISIPMIGSPAQNDVLILHVAASYNGAAVTFTTPSGWTLIREDTQADGGGNTLHAISYRKIAGASEVGPYSLAFSGGATMDVSIKLINIRYVNGTTPIDNNKSSLYSDGTFTSYVSPSAASTRAGELELLFYCQKNALAAWTAPIGTTTPSQSYNANGTFKVSNAFFYVQNDSPGAGPLLSATSTLAAIGIVQAITIMNASDIKYATIQILHQGNGSTTALKETT